MWIRPIFTIIPLNLSEFPKIGKFGIIFDAIPRKIDDLAVSSRHMICDPVDFESTQSTSGIQRAFDPMPRVNPRRMHSKRKVEHSPTG